MRIKVVFGNFRYRECDNLALYLEKMAREGWIFRDWRLGMVFEKEEPQKLEYAVEVFSEGNENDTKPEPETEEFAVYCREAGWELVSSRKKLCIFRKLSQDAAPIMEPEERYRSIKKAERESGGRWAIFICILGLSLLNGLRTDNPGEWIFDNLELALWITLFCLFIYKLTWFLDFRYWTAKARRALDMGAEPFYGKEGTWIYLWIQLRWLLPYLIALVYLTHTFLAGDKISGGLLLTIFIVVVFYKGWVGLLKPQRYRHEMAFMMILLILPVMVYGLWLGLVLAAPKEEEKIETAYGDGSVSIEEDKKGIMGRAVTYEITPADSSLLPEESVTCELYETPHAWLLDRMEELWSKESGKEMLIRDPGRMLRISGMDQLDADQILFIREALKI